MTMTESTPVSYGQPARPSASNASVEPDASGVVVAFTPRVASSDWSYDVDMRVKGLLLLDEGWDGGVAAPVSLHAVNMARELARQVAELLPDVSRPVVTPTVDGGVVLEWHSTSAHVDITLADDGVLIFYEVPQEGEVWEGSFDDAPINPGEILFTHFR